MDMHATVVTCNILATKDGVCGGVVFFFHGRCSRHVVRCNSIYHSFVTAHPIPCRHNFFVQDN